MNERQKLVIIGSYAPSLINFRGKLIEAAVKQGMHVIAMAPALDGETVHALKELGAEPIAYELQRTGMNVLSDFSTLLNLYRVFRDKRPDMVLSYTIKPVIYGSIAARLAGVRNVFSIITGLGFAFSAKGWKQRIVSVVASTLFRIALFQNRKVFFQNPDDRRFFEEKRLLAKEKCLIINGSGVDVDHFCVEDLPSMPRFLMIARLLKEKGVYEYVEAARAVRHEHANVQFDLAGWIDDAPTAIEKKQLDAWIDEGVINYLGKLSDVRQAIRNSGVYVLPSYREGTPRTVLEAMAMGRPIITTDAPGCRETVENKKNGILVPVGSVEALVKAMGFFLSHPQAMGHMGSYSRGIAEAKYDVHKVNKVILQEMSLS